MILTGTAIQNLLEDQRISSRGIVIEPPPSKIGPNSADLRLGPNLYRYRRTWLDRLLRRPIDPRDPPRLVKVRPASDGSWVLEPGVLYLGCTVEWTETYGLVPYLDGRSTLARLGVWAHLCAGRGDHGFRGRWTVELVAVHRVRLYPFDPYFQITYHETTGGVVPYDGHYQGDGVPAGAHPITR